jgi:hypothetical protein
MSAKYGIDCNWVGFRNFVPKFNNHAKFNNVNSLFGQHIKYQRDRTFI